MLTIEILHTPGCGRARVARARAEAVVARLCPGAEVVMTDVHAHPAARHRYAGSPTVLVDGRDIQPDVEPAPGAG